MATRPPSSPAPRAGAGPATAKANGPGAPPTPGAPQPPVTKSPALPTTGPAPNGDAPPERKRYLVHFAQAHEDFRFAELWSLAKLENVDLVMEDHRYDRDRPFLTVQLASDADAIKLVRRAILVKAIYALWEESSSYEALFDQIRRKPERNALYMTCSFKFVVETFNNSRALDYKVAVINRFAFMAFTGPIDLKNPDVTFGVLEDYDYKSDVPRHLYFGIQLGFGNRAAIDKFSLKKRTYLGTTSMDPQLSLIMGNLGLVRPGTLVYDPFVGTGSFLVTMAHFGAVTMGSDIDGRQIRGTGKGNARRGAKPGSASVWSNVEQYGLQDRVVDCLVYDMAHHPLRAGELFDAIITDPPYGVRAGAKKIGADPKRAEWVKRPNGSIALAATTTEPPAAEQAPRQLVSAKHPHGRYPQTVPYDLDAVMADLTDFAGRHLRVGGRIAYWLPTVKAEYADEDIPTHPALTLVANCEQPFGQWSRRLVTLEKTRTWVEGMRSSGSGQLSAKLERAGPGAPGALDSAEEEAKPTKTPGHKGFREKYFAFGLQAKEQFDAQQAAKNRQQTSKDVQQAKSEPHKDAPQPARLSAESGATAAVPPARSSANGKAGHAGSK
ncbi:hypothetical protein GGF31_008473 [Allomyces arbusculus]|nr:hypothetical protein GGF31_008473 [Allomyces arbusculus]